MRQRKKEDEEFINIGEKEEFIPKKMPIYKSNNQYSVKLPTEFMRKIGYEEGDYLEFTLINPPPTHPDIKPRLEIKYGKKD